MQSKIQKVLNKTQFFKIIKATNKNIAYSLEKPSLLLIRNVYADWLRYLNLKTQKFMPIYVKKLKHDLPKKTKGETLPFGIIQHNVFELKDKIFQYDFGLPSEKLELELKLIVPKQDIMQYFIQWQRYRKYWWSSISTTPSLFAIGDIQQSNTESYADIIAKLPCGDQTVEHIKIINTSEFKETACLTCTMSLEKALFILLLDGLSNNSKEDYLRLHRKIAPYKMSFALNFEEINNQETSKELATLLFLRLNIENVSAYLPDFSINSLQDQLKENLLLGIPYTAIINEATLQNGIFHLINSSTMLKEQLHISDFHTYAALICKS